MLTSRTLRRCLWCLLARRSARSRSRSAAGRIRRRTGEDSVFYYRIHSPVILIEFDRQLPFAQDAPAHGHRAKRGQISIFAR